MDNKAFLFLLTLIFDFLKHLFILGEKRVQEWAQVGGGEEVGKRISRGLHTRHRTHIGARSQNLKITIWAETKSQRLNWLHHPGTPIFTDFSSKWIIEAISATNLYDKTYARNVM